MARSYSDLVEGVFLDSKFKFIKKINVCHQLDLKMTRGLNTRERMYEEVYDNIFTLFFVQNFLKFAHAVLLQKVLWMHEIWFYFHEQE